MPAPVGAALVPPVMLQVPPVMLLLSNHSSIAFTVGASKLLLDASRVFTLFSSGGMKAAVALLLAITNASTVLKTPGVTGVRVMVFMPGVVYVCVKSMMPDANRLSDSVMPGSQLMRISPPVAKGVP